MVVGSIAITAREMESSNVLMLGIFTDNGNFIANLKYLTGYHKNFS